MSRIGKTPITINNGVTVTIENGGSYNSQFIMVKGPKGELRVDIRPEVKFAVEGSDILVTVNDKNNSPERVKSSYHGLYRSLVANAVNGVVTEYSKTLEIIGIGYKAQLAGNKIILTIGLTHDVPFELPAGISAEIKDSTIIIVKGIDKQLVGEVAAQIRKLKAPEPYKGKGIKYIDEVIRRKVGKTAAA
jgi:large subunit ribosomal protein L6